MSDEAKRSRWIQLAWLVTIWTASVAVIGAVAYGLRWLLHP
jgi:hypothetical protein